MRLARVAKSASLACAIASLAASCAPATPPPHAPPDTVSVRISQMPLVFRVSVAREALKGPTSGRLFVFVSSKVDRKDPFARDRDDPGGVFMAAMEVSHVLPGATLEIDPAHDAFPDFALATPGTYAVKALLDVDHSFAHSGTAGGDLTGPAVTLPFDPARTGMVDLRLDTLLPVASPVDTDTLKHVQLESPLLSAFFGRPMSIGAGVILPPGYGKDAKRRYPTAYLFTRFGYDEAALARDAQRYRDAMSAGSPAMVYVVLDGTWATGHHLFADSANNGPWSRALVEELLPHLEKRFLLVPRAGARFLTGQSAGGWASLWQQVTHPELFGGVWSLAPDPVDFRAYVGMADVTPETRDNFFRAEDGTPHVALRAGGRDLLTNQDAVRRELVQGDYGGPLLSSEWVFSPRGDDGRPLRLFDRVTGAIDPSVARAWERFDLRKRIEADGKTLAPKLRGKLHVFVGADDNFHLEAPTKLLCAALLAGPREAPKDPGAKEPRESGKDSGKERGLEATCEVLPGKDHASLSGDDPAAKGSLGERIAEEMQAAFGAVTAAQPPPAEAPRVARAVR